MAWGTCVVAPAIQCRLLAVEAFGSFVRQGADALVDRLRRRTRVCDLQGLTDNMQVIGTGRRRCGLARDVFAGVAGETIGA
jgi:hypothetical protein